QGITLTIAAAGAVPPTLIRAALAAALVLLAESFGRDVWWLWRHRHDPERRAAQASDGDAARNPDGGHGRGAIAVALTLLALLVVWAALVAPNQPSRLTLGAFVRLPLEGIVVVALALVLPGTARRLVA